MRMRDKRRSTLPKVLFALPLLGACAAVFPLDELSSGGEVPAADGGEDDASDANTTLPDSSDAHTVSPVAFVGASGVADTRAVNSLTLDVPAGTLPHDLLIFAVMEQTGVPGVSSLPGWIQLDRELKNGTSATLYVRWVEDSDGSSEPTSYTVTFARDASAAVLTAGVLAAYRNVRRDFTAQAPSREFVNATSGSPPATKDPPAKSRVAYFYFVGAKAQPWSVGAGVDSGIEFMEQKDVSYLSLFDVYLPDGFTGNFVGPSAVTQSASNFIIRAMLLPPQ